MISLRNEFRQSRHSFINTNITLFQYVIIVSVVLIITSGFITNSIRYILYIIISTMLGISYIQNGSTTTKQTLVITVALYVIFIAWMVISTVWSPSTNYAYYKISRMITINLMLILAGTYIGYKNTNIRLFISFLYITVLLFAAIGIFVVYTIELDPWEPFGFATHISLGRMVGLGVPISIVYMLASKRPLKHIIALSILGIGLYHSGTRQGIFAAGFVLFIIFIIYNTSGIKTAFFKLGKIIPITVSIFTFGMFVVLLFGSGENSFIGEIDSSALSRKEAWVESLAYWSQAPLLGHGVGSWPILQGGPDSIRYPHNIFLESLVELGTIGLIIFKTFILIPIVSCIKTDHSTNPHIFVIILSICLYSILISMLSRDLATNRLLYLSIGMLAGYAHTQRKIKFRWR